MQRIFRKFTKNVYYEKSVNGFLFFFFLFGSSLYFLLSSFFYELLKGIHVDSHISNLREEEQIKPFNSHGCLRFSQPYQQVWAMNRPWAGAAVRS